MHATVVTAPSELRDELRHLDAAGLTERAVRFRPGNVADPAHAARFTLRALARRCQHLNAEIEDLSAQLDFLIAAQAPQLLDHHGVGTDVAAALLVAVGDNPERLRSEASFAALC